jgi:hypothetical protein
MILDGWTRAGLRLSLRFSSVNFVRVLHGRAGLAVTHLAACTRERYSNCVIHGPSRASASPRRRSSRRSRRGTECSVLRTEYTESVPTVYMSSGPRGALSRGIFKPHLATRDSYVYGLNQINKSLCGPRATAARAETGDGDIGARGGGLQLGNNTRYARRYPGRLAYTKEEQGLRAV